jgi:hypothetical protein
MSVRVYECMGVRVYEHIHTNLRIKLCFFRPPLGHLWRLLWVYGRTGGRRSQPGGWQRLEREWV